MLDDTPLLTTQYTCPGTAQTIKCNTTDFTIFIQTFCFIQSQFSQIQANSVRKNFNNQQWKILIEQSLQ